MVSLKCYLNVCICVEVLRWTSKNVGQGSQSLGQDLNARPHEYKAGVLSTQSCLVQVCGRSFFSPV
jgi:hypothetical protein